MATERDGAQVFPDPDLGPKSWAPCNYCFIKFSPKHMVEVPEATHTPFTHPIPWGGGYQADPPRTFLPLRTTSVPNFVLIYAVVWILIENTHSDIAVPVNYKIYGGHQTKFWVSFLI